MKRMTGVVAAIILSVAALQSQTNESSTPQGSVVGAEVEGYQLSIVLRNTVFRTGDDVVATVCLKNVSTNIGKVPFNDGFSNYRFELLDARQQKVTPTKEGLMLLNAKALYHTGSRQLYPGLTYKVPVLLNKMFSMTNTGDYTFSASREVRKHWGSQEAAWVSTGPLQFTIVGPEFGTKDGNNSTNVASSKAAPAPDEATTSSTDKQDGE